MENPTIFTRFDKLCTCAATLGISGRRVADRLDISVMTLNRWRKGSHTPRAHDMEKSITKIKAMINDHIDAACIKVEDC